MMEERLHAAICPESTIDTGAHADRIIAAVTRAKMVAAMPHPRDRGHNWTLHAMLQAQAAQAARLA